MRVMPANSSGWFWHCLARETALLGHLYSPGAQRGPWEWFPYALDNGCFSLWDPKTNYFDEEKWLAVGLHKWRVLIEWAHTNAQRPLWAIVPDTPGNGPDTLRKWNQYVHELRGIPPALAVQDGMTPKDVLSLYPAPEVIAVGGSTEWKWSTVEMWTEGFPRVHVLRCNSPEKLEYLKTLQVESTDGTGWNRGDKKQTSGLESFLRRYGHAAYRNDLWPYVCKNAVKGSGQTSIFEVCL